MTADFGETSRRLDGSLPLHYHELGEGPFLILLHGSGPGVNGWSNFSGNLPVFAERFRTVILDLPGFGLSPPVKLDDRYPAVAARAIGVLLDALGVEQAHILGNSMGGLTAMEFAATNPERVSRLVLMGPGGINVLGPSRSEGFARLYDFLDLPTRKRMVAWVETMVADPAFITAELIDQRLESATAPGAIEAAREVFASLYSPEFKDNPPLWLTSSRVRCRTLITWGRDDRMVPLEHGLFAWRRMPAADMHIFSRCGHWAQIERKTDFERVVLEFLTSRPGDIPGA